MACRIGKMLKAQKRHISFHTPGHKRAGADITELSYSDNLYAPRGVLKRAQADLARITGAEKSFILTDGSTAGVHAMLYALKLSGARSVAFSVNSHPSVKAGCKLFSLTAVAFSTGEADGIPLQPTEEELAAALEKADALLLTSPDYYGNFPPLKAARALCAREGKLLLIDGAHGAHLHFTGEYAGRYADWWTDGVHKSLPALTQGALVSAGTHAELLEEAVKMIRTTSPSYPIMASVEAAMKLPRNLKIEAAAGETKRALSAYPNADWSKILIPFGEAADMAQAYLERRGVYPEFNDGNYLMFYLSPCTKRRHLKKLRRLIKKLPRGRLVRGAGASAAAVGECELVPPERAEGRLCARDCGPFPPSLPLIRAGERITREKLFRFYGKSAFGLTDGKFLVYREEE